MAAFSDKFDGDLDPRWVLRDPLGDITIETVGGLLNVGLPADVNHDLWPTTNNNAGRCVQPVPDADFEVVAKFNALPFNNGAGFGIIIEQGPSAADTLRTGFYSSGSGSIKAFFSRAESVHVNETITESVSGSVLYQKVTREGPTFTFSWSDDGVTYITPVGGVQVDLAFVTNFIGIYATNSGSPFAAFTSLTDFIEFASDPLGGDSAPDSDLFVALSGITP